MAKKINVKPIEKIQLEFEDGMTKDIMFSTAAVAVLDEEFDGGALKLISGVKEAPYAVGAKIIYAGMKVCDENITFDEAKKIIVGMPFDVVIDLMNEFIESFGTKANTKDIEAYKKKLMQGK